MTEERDSKGRPAFLLPWRLVLLLFAVSGLAAGFAAMSAGQHTVPGAFAGMILGFFGTIFGDRVRTILAIFCVTIASLATDMAPAWVSFYALAPAFAIIAGAELARFGSRVSVFAIMSWITLNSPATSTADTPSLLLVFMASAFAGTILVLVLKLEGRVPPTPVERGYAIAHGSALAIGLILSQIIASQFDNANSHWIALLFAARALDPPGSHIEQARSRGTAMVLGAGAASALVMLPIITALFQVMAVALLIVGLRYLPSGQWIAPALMSAGIVLATSPTTETAVFRAEAAVIASGLVLLVFFLARAIRRRLLENRGV